MKKTNTGKYIELNGIRTWYAEQGSGEPLVMLHPGGVDSSVFEPNVKALSKRFHIYLPERRGHGHTPDAPGPYSYERMADDTIQFLLQVVGGPARLMGCSDGSVVALMVARKRPDLVERLICAAGVYHNNGWHEGVIDLNAPAGGKTVEQKLDKMHADGPKLTEKDLKNIPCRTLVMIGDDDEVILEHAVGNHSRHFAWLVGRETRPLQQDYGRFLDA